MIPAGKGKISFLQCTNNGYINDISGQSARLRAVGQHKRIFVLLSVLYKNIYFSIFLSFSVFSFFCTEGGMEEKKHELGGVGRWGRARSNWGGVMWASPLYAVNMFYCH